jgi:predicted nucleotidyltransferase
VIASLEDVLRVMHEHHVRCIVIGGWAAILHGSARSTSDVDLVYDRNVENLKCLVAALGSQQPYLRGAPSGLPFHWDERTIEGGLNFALTTSLGDLDLLGEVAGGGRYEQLLPFTQEVSVFGFPCRVVSLEGLIKLKRAAGRPKDLEAIAELQTLLEERRKSEPHA